MALQHPKNSGFRACLGRRGEATCWGLVFTVAVAFAHAPAAFAQGFTHTYTPVPGQNLLKLNSIWTPSTAPNSPTAFVNLADQGTGPATLISNDSQGLVVWGGFEMGINSPNLAFSQNTQFKLQPTSPYTSTIASGRTLQLGVTSTQGFLEGNASATLANSGTIRSGDSASSAGGQISNIRINNSSTGAITSASNSFLVQNSDISGGKITITNTNLGRITYQGGSLNDVTLTRTGNGFHEVAQSMVLNGITVDNGVLHLRANTTLSGASSLTNYGTIDNNTGRTITMAADANLTGQSGAQLLNRTMLLGQGTFTDLVIQGGGTINATTGNFSYAGGSLSNQTLSATGANLHQVTSGTLNLFGATTLATGTSLNVTSGGLSFAAGMITINGSLQNSNTTTGISISNNSTVAGNGTLINDAGSVISGNGTLNVANITNAGTIQGKATPYGIAINSSGGVDNTGGTLGSGTSTGAVLTLNTTVTGGTIQVGGLANVAYAGGKITGSMLTEAAGAAGIHKVTGNSTFDNVTLAADTAFTIDAGTIATFENGFNSFGNITNNGTMVGHLVLQSGATYSGGGIFNGQIDRIGSSNVVLADSPVDVLGGISTVGGLSVAFPELSQTGVVEATSSIFLAGDLPMSGALGNINFAIPGQHLQAWDISFGGSFVGLATLTFAYDRSLLGEANESDLQIYHWNGSLWEMLTRLALDTGAQTITVETSSFSPFALGVGAMAAVPEPSSLTIFALGALGACGYRRSKKPSLGLYQRGPVDR